jgi:hypothetical protein
VDGDFPGTEIDLYWVRGLGIEGFRGLGFEGVRGVWALGFEV